MKSLMQSLLVYITSLRDWQVLFQQPSELGDTGKDSGSGLGLEESGVPCTSRRQSDGESWGARLDRTETSWSTRTCAFAWVQLALLLSAVRVMVVKSKPVSSSLPLPAPPSCPHCLRGRMWSDGEQMVWALFAVLHCFKGLRPEGEMSGDEAWLLISIITPKSGYGFPWG